MRAGAAWLGLQSARSEADGRPSTPYGGRVQGPARRGTNYGARLQQRDSIRDFFAKRGRDVGRSGKAPRSQGNSEAPARRSPRGSSGERVRHPSTRGVLSKRSARRAPGATPSLTVSFPGYAEKGHRQVRRAEKAWRRRVGPQFLARNGCSVTRVLHNARQGTRRDDGIVRLVTAGRVAGWLKTIPFYSSGLGTVVTCDVSTQQGPDCRR